MDSVERMNHIPTRQRDTVCRVVVTSSLLGFNRLGRDVLFAVTHQQMGEKLDTGDANSAH